MFSCWCVCVCTWPRWWLMSPKPYQALYIAHPHISLCFSLFIQWKSGRRHSHVGESFRFLGFTTWLKYAGYQHSSCALPSGFFGPHKQIAGRSWRFVALSPPTSCLMPCIHDVLLDKYLCCVPFACIWNAQQPAKRKTILTSYWIHTMLIDYSNEKNKRVLFPARIITALNIYVKTQFFKVFCWGKTASRDAKGHATILFWQNDPKSALNGWWLQCHADRWVSSFHAGIKDYKDQKTVLYTSNQPVDQFSFQTAASPGINPPI